ncbi:hypothetical protein [Flavobacterium palustre]|uniref:hypothetical protein n=1 Tax=Flavobacterium palustre TaxID=1476463 RepID=UPI003611DE45
MLNLGYLDNTGMLKYTNFERYTARLNANFKLFNDKVRFGINSQFTQSNERLAANDVGNSPVPALAISLAPTIPVYTNSGGYGGPLGSDILLPELLFYNLQYSVYLLQPKESLDCPYKLLNCDDVL